MDLLHDKPGLKQVMHPLTQGSDEAGDFELGKLAFQLLWRSAENPLLYPFSVYVLKIAAHLNGVRFALGIAQIAAVRRTEAGMRNGKL